MRHSDQHDQFPPLLRWGRCQNRSSTSSYGRSWTEKCDFGDGCGPVPAHRHTNGGGWVANTAHVDASAYVGPQALVYDQAQILDQARVSGKARVYGEARTSPLCLTGAEYRVTIDDTLVTIGCLSHSLDEWITQPPPEKCPCLEALREAIISLAKTHQKGAKCP